MKHEVLKGVLVLGYAVQGQQPVKKEMKRQKALSQARPEHRTHENYRPHTRIQASGQAHRAARRIE